MYCFRSYENTSSFYMIITQTNTNLKLHIFTVSIPDELFIQGYSKVRSIQSNPQDNIRICLHDPKVYMKIRNK